MDGLLGWAAPVDGLAELCLGCRVPGTQEEKDQCAESTKEHILADNGESKSSEQEEQCQPSNEIPEESYEEQPSGPGNMEEKDNPDTDTAVNSSPSNLETGTQEEKDQCAEAPKENILADNGESKSSEQGEQCQPSNETLEESYEEQPQCPKNMEDKDNPDTDTAVNSSPSNLETEKGPMKLPLKIENEQKEDPESPEKTLQPKEEDSESPGQKQELKTPREGDEETDGKTPTNRAVLQEENPNITENTTRSNEIAYEDGE
ncbi:uncharacterized protein [Pyxicephalus adspersus]|uniref:uncharacterized protein n=1 Tax=Pyxicephalus adspersus TaxID=30357 RepID=UPI003B5CEE05